VRRLVTLLVSGAVVAGLAVAALVFGLRGVEVLSWVAGSASLVVAVVTLVVSWPGSVRGGGRMATGDIDQSNTGGNNVANSGQVTSARIAGPPAPPGETAPEEDEAQKPGSIRQRNTGGTNIANTGTVGSIDISQ